jgi:ATP-binding cassette subfamily B protein
MGTPEAATRGSAPFGVFSLLPELRRERRLFGEAYFASLMLHVLGLCTPLFFGAVLDKVVVHHASSTLLVLTIGIVLALAFDALIGLTHDYLLVHANPRIDMRVAARVFGHTLSLPLPFFARNQAGALIRDIQQDQAVRGFLTNSLFFSLTELTALLVLLPLLFSFSPVLTSSCSASRSPSRSPPPRSRAPSAAGSMPTTPRRGRARRCWWRRCTASRR